MWLLNTTLLDLEYFADCRHKNVRYAILSHTWEYEEVTFEELRLGTGEKKRGYQKIAKTCELAAEEGYKYAWIDTCCIDKKSSAELSEAINSMWNWYCCAQICYVYLSDVDAGGPILCDHDILNDEDNLQGSSDDMTMNFRNSQWYEQFRGSRWFTRGWTLQELIAPEKISFFNCEWEFIGTKLNLVQFLSEITGIDQAVVVGRDSLPEFVIARKMSWAVGRRTSRIEDRAYSLLGIFGIHMPLLYGEGEKAFTRLQEALVQISTDHSILVWQAQNEGDLIMSPDLDMLFAKSPDSFGIGKHVVRWNSSAANSHHVLTSKGLEFHSNLFIKGGQKCLMLLNCRFEDNLQGPLALRLSQSDQSTVGSKMELPHRNDYYINGRAAHSEGFTHAPDIRLVRSKRLMIFRAYDIASRQTGRSTILRYQPHSYIYRCSDMWPPLKIWLKQGDSSEESFETLQALPRKLWNISTGGHVLSKLYCKTVEPVSQDDLDNLVDAGLAEHKCELPLEESKDYSATVQESEIMGDHVHVVYVAKHTAARSST